MLARAWQMLLKGIDEAKEASRPLAAADMVVVRLAHAADLPTPDEALKALAATGGAAAVARRVASRRSARRPAAAPAWRWRRRRIAAASARSRAAQPSQPASAAGRARRRTPRLETFADLVALAGEKRELKLKHALETTVRPIRFEPGQIEIALTEHASPGLAGELSRKLEQWTGTRWMIAVSRDGGEATIAETRKNAREKLVDDARADPVVAAVFARFPGAEIVDVRVRGGEVPAAAMSAPAPASRRCSRRGRLSDGDGRSHGHDEAGPELQEKMEQLQEEVAALEVEGSRRRRAGHGRHDRQERDEAGQDRPVAPQARGSRDPRRPDRRRLNDARQRPRRSSPTRCAS